MAGRSLSFSLGPINWLFGNCRENETGFNSPPNVFNDLAGQARGFCSRSHGNSQRADKFTPKEDNGVEVDFVLGK
jgi:hypothetical protein